MLKVSQLGLCGWSIDRHDPIRGIVACRDDFDVGIIQIGFFRDEVLRNADAEAIRNAIEAAGVTLAGTFVAFEGEDYSTIERIAATGGLAADNEYRDRLELIRRAVALTAKLGGPSVSIHAATIPGDAASGHYVKLIDRVRQAADIAGQHGLRLLLETGREPASVLFEFTTTLDRENVGVSFDVGNFVIYGTGEPVQEIRTLGKHIDLVHVKDAFRSNEPGDAFGQRALVGEGDANIARVLSRLRAIGFAGPILLEASAARDGASEIRAALAYLRSMLA